MEKEMTRKRVLSNEIGEMLHKVRKIEEEIYERCTGSNNRCRENGGHLVFWECQCAENEKILSAMSRLGDAFLEAMDALYCGEFPTKSC